MFACFVRSDAIRHILNDHKEELKLLHPDLITSTKLRKQLASYSQLLNLTEQELEGMANFMGMRHILQEKLSIFIPD